MNRDRSQAMDHVVPVPFENRSFDNLLGHLYGPEDGKTFEGVIGKELSNPIPEWAERGSVPYTVTDDMDAPNPDSGEDKVWDLGEPFTERDAAATPFDHLLAREIPPELSDPDAHLSTEETLTSLRGVLAQFFPQPAAGRMAGL